MEHPSDLKFSIGILNRDLDRLNSFMRILKETYSVYGKTLKEIESLEGTLDVIFNPHKEIKKFDPIYAVRCLRANLNWLKQQVKEVPHQQRFVDEIEYLTKLLKNYGKIKYWDKLKNSIARGEKGLNTGIPFQGFTSLSKHIKNIQQGRYDLIFAGTSVDKTAFVNSTYVYGAIDFLQNNPGYVHDVEIIYYSLEIPPENQIAKHIAGLIWKEHGILTSMDGVS